MCVSHPPIHPKKATKRTGHDLSIVGTKGDRQDVLVVADEPPGGLAAGNVPQAQLAVPRRAQGKGAVAGNDNVRDEVIVAVQRPFGVTVIVGGVRETPNDDRLVATAAQEQVGIFGRRRQGRDPIIVADQRATQRQTFTAHAAAAFDR
jgi:hypothetical protein